MKAKTKIQFLDDHNEKFFGEGPARLLRQVELTGSLRGASISMDMAYTKALKLIKNAEKTLGFPLIKRVTGGKDGGGSILTEEGKGWLERYEQYQKACVRENERLYHQFFSDEEYHNRHYDNVGCIIMAAGLGKRFGSNKLMADFHNQPLISKILDVTENLFAHRVVVTRHEDVAKLCKKRGIQTVLHDLPHRSDTIRLGLEALPDVKSCIFCPGDQPLLKRKTIESLLLAAEKDPDSIWRTYCDGVPGSPVLFPAWTFLELKNLPEGKGGGFLIKKYPERLRLISVQDMYELKDVDCPEDLIDLLER